MDDMAKNDALVGVLEKCEDYGELRQEVESRVMDEIKEGLIDDLIEASVSGDQFAVATLFEEVQRTVSGTIEDMVGHG